jgi:hypothetical protein
MEIMGALYGVYINKKNNGNNGSLIYVYINCKVMGFS